jgi:hypothetical protein
MLGGMFRGTKTWEIYIYIYIYFFLCFAYFVFVFSYVFYVSASLFIFCTLFAFSLRLVFIERKWSQFIGSNFEDFERSGNLIFWSGVVGIIGEYSYPLLLALDYYAQLFVIN